ncbi:unnamed protein product [Adineta steineri]|uniref:Uncharacterized protein n=1 Tax=Adineta steineri TaxID=433720 RepID=A0A815Q6F9_9BILA|nr:unnamed protein product [Adineta steineri]CAF1424275.1 unnamed protein product [Adineta steineri]CAF1458210.1 unnamed protein product [Adineta steineri]
MLFGSYKMLNLLQNQKELILKHWKSILLSLIFILGLCLISFYFININRNEKPFMLLYNTDDWSNFFHYSYNYNINSSTPILCIITRIYEPQVSYFPVFALALLHTGLDNIRIYVTNTDRRTDIRQLKQTISFLNKFVLRKDYITFLNLGDPPQRNDDGYVMTNRALSYIYEQNNHSSSACQYIVVTNGDNFYSQIFGKRILPHMKDGKDMIAWGFVSHHYKPHYKEFINQTNLTVLQIIDDGTGKCTPVAFRAGFAELGSVAYRLAFLKKHNLYFNQPDASYSVSLDGYFVEQAAQRASSSVILKQTLFFHQ